VKQARKEKKKKASTINTRHICSIFVEPARSTGLEKKQVRGEGKRLRERDGFAVLRAPGTKRRENGRSKVAEQGADRDFIDLLSSL